VPNKYLIVCGISIETMPMLHYYPKGKFLQITTTGCNFECPGCISSVLVKDMGEDSAALQYRTPEEIVAKAIEEGCLGITFIMNDPLASYFTFLDVAKKAKQMGLLMGCSSNGYFTEYSATQLASYIDFINIGLKGFDDESYQSCGGASLQPVLANIETFYKKGIHLEISCMYKKGDEVNIKNLAQWIAGIDHKIPLQVMRYIPLDNAVLKWEPTIKETEQQCRLLKSILDYVYLFNSPGTEALNTYCKTCGTILIERNFYGPMGAKVKSVYLQENKCPSCNTDVAVHGIQEREAYKENGFEGGYPFTRALEMVQAILIAVGVNSQKEVVKVWEKLLQNNGIQVLHHDVQKIDQYIETILKYASYCGAEEKAEILQTYLKDKLAQISSKVNGIAKKPRVYYAMGKPLFCIKGERFENQLVAAAGGVSVNKEIELNGRPGSLITPEQLNALNPEYIFISSFLSNDVDEFYQQCIEKGVDVEAVRKKQIYKHPFPNWDFGSPRWILGLMFMGNTLHPELFDFDLNYQANLFYEKFYGQPFDPENMNLSFGKPSADWHFS
jgi:pyruvate-formate lyase-activating enzyme